MSESPALLVYEGEGAFRAVNRAAAQRADRDYVIGERYLMTAEEERSGVSHRQLFAWINERWMSLPDHLATEFTSADRLRYRALVATGWFTERRLATSSPEEARKVWRFMAQAAGDNTVYALAGNVVIERTARTQKMRGPDRMNKADFQKSKQDVLDWIDDLLGITSSPSISPARGAARSGVSAAPPSSPSSATPKGGAVARRAPELA